MRQGKFGQFSSVIIFCMILFSKASEKLELVTEEELLNLIRSEKYVVVLFSKPHCEECNKFENELISTREDLVDALGAWVVKIENSQLIRLYSPSKEPVIVFFRHGIPLLYDGPVNDEMILHTFTNNKEPLAKELTDETFEHLTQAATGATTGDWFVMFYTNECVDCQRLQARWEAVGAHLKTRMNIARVNRGSTGAATGRRFDVFDVPAFILFRQGKMYRYEIRNYDVKSLVSFATEFYKNIRAEKVPVPKSPFDDLIAAIVVYLKENPWVWQFGGMTFVIGLIAALLVNKKSSVKPSSKKKAAKKEK
ncbi:thioredoxin domain-containing protein [Agrilus planipennis]|uniref:Thioredoxin domain-containing protein n=1 Tax=Agrilus planipennis TaxID=224129 RepID=A0A1W4WE73_AGRPL|nr:thioredoxin domain-containing protein [Agrilus planipennis]